MILVNNIEKKVELFIVKELIEMLYMLFFIKKYFMINISGVGNGNVSPRKHRRLRDSPRRKTANNINSTKSPTSNNHSGYRLENS